MFYTPLIQFLRSYHSLEQSEPAPGPLIEIGRLKKTFTSTAEFGKSDSVTNLFQKEEVGQWDGEIENEPKVICS